MPRAIGTEHPDLRLRLASPADDDFIAGLFKATRAAQFASAGLAGPVLVQLLDQQFRLQADSYARQFPRAISLVVEWKERAIGRLLLDHTERRWHIVDITLLASYCRQGIGAMVMRGVEVAARRDGVASLTLMVLDTNCGARRFYEWAGFVAAGNPARGYLPLAKSLGPCA